MCTYLFFGDDPAPQRNVQVASLLKEMDGAMYTGCDMNTTTADMDYLDGQCPYVLAAIANPAVCPNTATAYGVFGAVEACLGGDVRRSILSTMPRLLLSRV